jgi:rubrerythrin
MTMKVQEDLATAFAGESQANRKYLMFAEQADKEGHKNVGRLFRAAAFAEQIHAFKEFRLMGGVKTTAENLAAAKAGETYEFTEMYPPMVNDAEAEGNAAAKMAFHGALEAEKVHARLYGEALANLGNDDGDSYYVCPICGYIHKGKPTDKCPICTAPADKFIEFK